MGEIGQRVYDDQDCEQFSYHVHQIVRACAEIDRVYGHAYGDEYRRQLADLIQARLPVAPA